MSTPFSELFTIAISTNSSFSVRGKCWWILEDIYINSKPHLIENEDADIVSIMQIGINSVILLTVCIRLIRNYILKIYQWDNLKSCNFFLFVGFILLSHPGFTIIHKASAHLEFSRTNLLVLERELSWHPLVYLNVSTNIIAKISDISSVELLKSLSLLSVKQLLPQNPIYEFGILLLVMNHFLLHWLLWLTLEKATHVENVQYLHYFSTGNIDLLIVSHRFTYAELRKKHRGRNTVGCLISYYSSSLICYLWSGRI